jgi:predicted small secreted protein
MLKRLVLGLFAAAVLLAVGNGYRTAHGAGEDISHVGDKIQEHTPP